MQSNYADGIVAGSSRSSEASPSRPTQANSSNSHSANISNTASTNASECAHTCFPDGGQGHVTQGKLTNPREVPRVVGSWGWASMADRSSAAGKGYLTPIDVTMARSRGEIADDANNNSPRVTFTPNHAHLNPDAQPEGEGFWTYLTVALDGCVRVKAWATLGGKEEYGFADVLYPTAHQVWELKQRMIAEGRDTRVLDGIDLAWVIDLQPRHTIQATDFDILNSARSKASQGSNIDSSTAVADSAQGLHDPTNGGNSHDQMGNTQSAVHRTMEIQGTRYTCDVSPAVLGRAEPHKFEIPDKKGVWRKWGRASEMDWKDKKFVTALNAWRDQKFNRGDWPKKRDRPRPPYTEAQKRWAFDIVSENAGKSPGSATLRDICVKFNAKFGDDRTPSAMSALCARMHDMYVGNDGKFVVGPKRGQANAERAASKRKEREEREESEGPRKRRRSEDGEGGGEEGEDAGAGERDEAEDGTMGEMDGE